MSTAIDFGALLRRAKATKKSSTLIVPSTVAVDSHHRETPERIHNRFLNTESLEESYKVSPEGMERAFYVPEFVTIEEESDLLAMIYRNDESDTEKGSKWISLSHRRLKVFGGTPDAQGTLKRPLPDWTETFIKERLEPFLQSTPPLEAFNKFDHVLLNEYSQGSGIAPHLDGPLYHSRVCILNLQSRAVMHFWRHNLGTDSVASSTLLSSQSSLLLSSSSSSSQTSSTQSSTQSSILPPSSSSSSSSSHQSSHQSSHESSPQFSSSHQYHQQESPSVSSPSFSLILEPRSLLIFEGSLYYDFKHGIPNALEDDMNGLLIANARFLPPSLLDLSSPLSRGTLPRLSLTLRSIKNRSDKSESDVVTLAEKEDLRRSQIQFYRNVSELN